MLKNIKYRTKMELICLNIGAMIGNLINLITNDYPLTLIFSSTLGSLSNSPSALFIASDGSSLRMYQAVIDARTLLHENTAKPKVEVGCFSIMLHIIGVICCRNY